MTLKLESDQSPNLVAYELPDYNTAYIKQNSSKIIFNITDDPIDMDGVTPLVDNDPGFVFHEDEGHLLGVNVGLKVKEGDGGLRFVFNMHVSYDIAYKVPRIYDTKLYYTRWTTEEQRKFGCLAVLAAWYKHANSAAENENSPNPLPSINRYARAAYERVQAFVKGPSFD